MGVTSSANLFGPVQALEPSIPDRPYFVLYFHIPDKIRIVSADRDTIEIIRRACLNRSLKSFKKEKSNLGEKSYVLKFHGCPFQRWCGTEAAIWAMSMAVGILSDLYVAGWDCLFASGLSRIGALSTWFFQRVSSVRRQKAPVVCVSMCGNDKLQLIAAPERPLKVELDRVVKARYEKGVQKERRYGECVELKLHGNPWLSCRKKNGIEVRKMIMTIASEFACYGYRPYVTANVLGTDECLFFIRQPTVDTLLRSISTADLNDNDKLRLIKACAVAVPG